MAAGAGLSVLLRRERAGLPGSGIDSLSVFSRSGWQELVACRAGWARQLVTLQRPLALAAANGQVDPMAASNLVSLGRLFTS